MSSGFSELEMKLSQLNAEYSAKMLELIQEEKRHEQRQQLYALHLPVAAYFSFLHHAGEGKPDSIRQKVLTNAACNALASFASTLLEFLEMANTPIEKKEEIIMVLFGSPENAQLMIELHKKQLAEAL